jgi:recombinational DNA repair protein RecR
VNPQQYSSSLLENAVQEFAKLPGIGRKTALRLVLHLLKETEEEVENFGNSIIELKKNIYIARFVIIFPTVKFVIFAVIFQETNRLFVL